MIAMKKIALILSCWVFVLSLCYVALEISVLRWLPHAFPIASVMTYLDPDIQVLAQYSKRNVVPENYIAIFGDSYAFGQGDWLFEQQDKITPFYNAPHLLHKKNGRDIVSFGRPASSSIKGHLEDPISQLAYIRSLHRYDIKDPEMAILYFYEGNDVVDNWKEYHVRYQGRGYQPTNLNNEENFSEFIESAILQENSAVKKSLHVSFSDRLIFGRFALSLLAGESHKLVQYIESQVNTKPFRPMFKPQARDTNIVVVAGREEKIPDGLQVPPIALHQDEIDSSMMVFDQVLRQARKRWPHTRLGIIYVPSVAVSYRIVSESVNIYDTDRGKSYPSSLVIPASDMTCNRIQTIAAANNVYFLDARNAIRHKASQEFIHGPVDWLHFNEAGYRVLADEIEKLMAQIESSGLNVGCAKLALDSGL